MCSAAPLALRIGAEASLGLARQTLPLRFTNAHTCARSRKVRCRRKSSAQKAHRIASHCALQRLRRIRADLCHCRGPRPFRSDKCMTIVQLASSPRRDGTLASHSGHCAQPKLRRHAASCAAGRVLLGGMGLPATRTPEPPSRRLPARRAQLARTAAVTAAAREFSGAGVVPGRYCRSRWLI
jgi:hypothetical protein